MDASATFINAIQQKKRVEVYFFSLEKGRPQRMVCIPFDYGPRAHSFYHENLYHCYTNENAVVHILYLRPKQVYSINVLEETFDPHEISRQVAKEPNWHVARDWSIAP